ncbi:MAG: hypothetical protein WC374_08255 [Phycisphaerae bacterium]|jgi:hypothetical protein
MNLMKNILVSEALAPVTAGQQSSKSDVLDMQGYDGVLFVVPITDCTSGAVATLTVQENTANSTTGMASITSASATNTSTAGDDQNNKLLLVDVYRPLKRYVMGLLTIGTQDAASGNMLAIRYCGSKAPIAEDATILDATVVVGS